MCPVCPVLTGSLDHAMGKRAVKPASRVTDKAIVAQRPQPAAVRSFIRCFVIRPLPQYSMAEPSPPNPKPA